MAATIDRSTNTSTEPTARHTRGVAHGRDAYKRERVLRAAVEVLAERGVRGATVRMVCRRAQVARPTFLKYFANLDDCVIAALDQALEHGLALVDEAFASARGWRDGMRASLLASLEYLEDEPELAQVVMVHAFAAGRKVLAHRRRVANAFCERVVEHVRNEIPREWPDAAASLFESVLGRLRDELALLDESALVMQLGPSMVGLLAPFCDEQELAEELRRSDELARASLAERARREPLAAASAGESAALPGVVANPRAWRVHECLRFLGEHPGASNREVGEGIGVAHPEQVSRLLTRLRREGLATNASRGAGKPNEWRLTPAGERARDALGGEPSPTPGRTARGARFHRPAAARD